MGRSLLIADSSQDTIDRLLNSQALQVGLVLGQLSESKDYAVHFAKCPDPVDNEAQVEEVNNDDYDETCEKQLLKRKRREKKILDNDDIDTKWIIEHARQVNRMLTGGISVIGIYICSSPEALGKHQVKMLACLQSIYKRIEKNKFIRSCLPHYHRYMLHICLRTKKITCKSIDVQDNQSSLSPAENRFQSFLSNWSYISTCVDVNVQLLVPVSQETSSTENKILYACQHELEDVINSFTTIGGKLIDKNKLVNENLKSKKGKDFTKEIKVTLFKQINSGRQKNYIKYDKANAYVKFVGSIVSKAFVNSKATYDDAVKALKLDIIRSILTRIELLCEELEINNMCHVEEWSLMSPSRVFAPFRKSDIYFSDYIFKDESAGDTLSRFSELLDIVVQKVDLVYPERSPEINDVSMILHGESPADHQSDIASELSNLSTLEEPQGRKIVAAVLTGFAAFVVGVFHFFWRE